MLINQGIHSDGANIKFEACQLNCSESESEWSNYLCISTRWSCKEVGAENDIAYIKLETCQLRRKSELKENLFFEAIMSYSQEWVGWGRKWYI